MNDEDEGNSEREEESSKKSLRDEEMVEDG